MLLALLLAAAPVDAEVAGFWKEPNVERLRAPAKVELFRVRDHELGVREPPLILDAGVIGGYVGTQSTCMRARARASVGPSTAFASRRRSG